MGVTPEDPPTCPGDTPNSELPVDAGSASGGADGFGKSYLTLSSRCGSNTGRHKGMGAACQRRQRGSPCRRRTAQPVATVRLNLPGPPARERTCLRPQGQSQVAARHRRVPVLTARSLGTLWMGHDEPGLLGPGSSGLQHPLMKPAQRGRTLGQPRARNFSLGQPSWSALDVELSAKTPKSPEALGGTGAHPSTQGPAQARRPRRHPTRSLAHTEGWG